MSARTRVRLLVGLAALAAAGIAVGATLIGRDGDDGGQAAARKAPPLELSITLRDDAEARALREAERAYDRGDRATARRRFDALAKGDPDSLEAAVGAAVAAWPDGTLARLRALAAKAPDSALVRLHLGLALYAAGQDKGAAAQWREARRRQADSPSAVRADDLLHPELAPGLPFFYASFRFPQGLEALPGAAQLETLRRAASRGGVEENLRYGVALQRVGRPLSARAAFARALALEPESLRAQVADAVGRFDKDDPSQAFSRLGPLSRDHADSALVRFHLGLLLLWIRDVENARTQLMRAAAADRGGFYGREARALLSRLETIRS